MSASHTLRDSSAVPHGGETLVVVVVAIVALAWIFLLEVAVAAAWLSPVGWLLAMSPATLLLSFAMTPAYAKKAKIRWVACIAFLLGVLVILVPWNERKRFVHDVFSVRVGMSVDEVETVMVGYIKGAGAAWHLPQELGPRVRHPDDPEDAAWAELARASFDSYRAPDYPSGERRQHFTGTMTYRWSTQSAYNADWGLVEFVNGKVVKADFLPD